METTKKAKCKKTITDVVITLVTLALIVFFVRLVNSKIKGEPYFLFNRYSLIWVLTDSMEEEISARSYILIEKIEGSEAEVGDVITFFSSDPTLEGNLNTHRVVRIVSVDDGFRLITKGDNNYTEDNYEVLPENVVGRYLTTLPFLSMIGRVFLTNAGLLFIFIGMLLMICFSIYNSVLALKQSKKREKEEAELSARTEALLKESEASGKKITPEEAQAQTAKAMEMERRIAEEVEKLKAAGYITPKK